MVNFCSDKPPHGEILVPLPCSHRRLQHRLSPSSPFRSVSPPSIDLAFSLCAPCSSRRRRVPTGGTSSPTPRQQEASLPLYGKCTLLPTFTSRINGGDPFSVLI